MTGGRFQTYEKSWEFITDSDVSSGNIHAGLDTLGSIIGTKSTTIAIGLIGENFNEINYCF